MARPPRARAPLKQAALELFVEHGVAATGIRDIARHAGVSEAALYRHWENKEALVIGLFTEHLEEVRALMADTLHGSAPVRARLHAAVAATCRLYDEQPLVFRFVLLVEHELARRLPADLRMPTDEVIAFARDSGLCRGDPVKAAAGMMGVFLQTAQFVHYGRLPGPLGAHVESMTATALAVLGS